MGKFLEWLKNLFKPRPKPPPEPPPPSGELLNAVNAERYKAGLAPLKANHLLAEAAAEHAVWMRETGRLTHEGKGGGPDRRAADMGYRGGYVGEAVAQGQRTAPLVVATWMNSPGHRSILLGQYEDAGWGRSGDYWCLIVGST